jgi:hypothetical protein
MAHSHAFDQLSKGDAFIELLLPYTVDGPSTIIGFFPDDMSLTDRNSV